MMLQSLNIYAIRATAKVTVNVGAAKMAPRSANPLSGHVDFTGTLIERREFDNQLVWRIAVPESSPPHLCQGLHRHPRRQPHGGRGEPRRGLVRVWLIPETRRATVFEDKRAGDVLNIEIGAAPRWWWTPCPGRARSLDTCGRAERCSKACRLDDFVRAPWCRERPGRHKPSVFIRATKRAPERLQRPLRSPDRAPSGL